MPLVDWLINWLNDWLIDFYLLIDRLPFVLRRIGNIPDTTGCCWCSCRVYSLYVSRFSWYFQNRFQAIPTHHPPVKQHAKRRVVKSCDWILRHRCSIPPCKYMWSTCELTGLHKGTEITTFEVHSWRNSTVSIKHCSTKFDVDIWRLGAQIISYIPK